MGCGASSKKGEAYVAKAEPDPPTVAEPAPVEKVNDPGGAPKSAQDHAAQETPVAGPKSANTTSDPKEAPSKTVSDVEPKDELKAAPAAPKAAETAVQNVIVAAPSKEEAPAAPPPKAVEPTNAGRTSLTSSQKLTTGFRSEPGLGDGEYPGFSADTCPDEMPDLSKHHSVMADVLKKTPSLYALLKDQKTPNGVTFAKCIKTGMDNPGHPMIKTVGMVAGDEESYEVFKELFDPVIKIRHVGYDASAVHPTDMDISKLSTTVVDPTGDFVVSTRVRAGRSIKGLRLPPSCSKEERREVERVVVRALLGFQGELKGDYYPLATSTSYRPKPLGMSSAQEEEMRQDHFLFQEPDSSLLLSSGMGRHWPDGRGIFANGAKSFLLWTNEEDHTRITSMETGADVKSVFERFAKACSTMEEAVKKEGYGFMQSEHLGFVAVCPSNLGTGLRASMMVKLQKLSVHPDFKDICKTLKLQARGGSGADSSIWEVSNSARLGTSEVDVMNSMIEGCAKIIQMELKLANGDDIIELIPSA